MEWICPGMGVCGGVSASELLQRHPSLTAQTSMDPPLQNTVKTTDSSLEAGGVRDTRGSGGSGEREHVHPYHWGIQCWACLRISPLRSESLVRSRFQLHVSSRGCFFSRNVRRIWCFSFSLLFIFEIVFHHVSRRHSISLGTYS